MKRRTAIFAMLVTSMAFAIPVSAAPPGDVSTVAGGNGNGSQSDEFSGPQGVTLNSEGTLFVADTDNHRIQRITFDGGGTPSYSTILGTGSAGTGLTELDSPADLAFAPDGSLFVVDTGNHRLQRVTFDSNGDFDATESVFGSGSAGIGVYELSLPASIAIAADGTVFIADRNNNRVQRIAFGPGAEAEAGVTVAGDTAGNPGSADDRVDQPYGIALDASGTLYVADSGNDRVQMISFDGAGDPTTAVSVAGSNGSGDAANQLNAPYGVGVRADGTIYVADSDNDRIQEITFDGNGEPELATTVAGGNGRGSGDAQLNTPYDIGFDTDGNLYTPDRGNHRIQKLTLASLDTTDPSIDLTTPAATRVGGTTTVQFSCADPGGSNIATCTATLNGQPVEDGDVIATLVRGTNTLVVTATDNAGNTTSTSTTFLSHGKRELAGQYRQLTGPGGAIARLYMAAFTREPESAGFTFWTTNHDDGMQLESIAAHFASGSEFKAHYNTTSDTEFVELMYNTILGRSAETSGHAYWLGRLGNGLTRAELLLFFSGSPEFKSITYTS